MEAVAAGGGQRQPSQFKQSHRRGLRSNSEQEFRLQWVGHSKETSFDTKRLVFWGC
jgi:hypothetical protein